MKNVISTGHTHQTFGFLLTQQSLKLVFVIVSGSRMWVEGNKWILMCVQWRLKEALCDRNVAFDCIACSRHAVCRASLQVEIKCLITLWPDREQLSPANAYCTLCNCYFTDWRPDVQLGRLSTLASCVFLAGGCLCDTQQKVAAVIASVVSRDPPLGLWADLEKWAAVSFHSLERDWTWRCNEGHTGDDLPDLQLLQVTFEKVSFFEIYFYIGIKLKTLYF